MNPVYSAQECQLSDAQSGIWIAEAIDPASPAFNIAEYVDIRGPLRPGLFAAALRQVVNESDALRVRISSHPDGVRQSVASLLDWELPVIDFSSQTEPFAAADAWMRDNLARPVQPDREPLFFYALLRLGPDRVFWYVRYHHLCMDGFGGALIAKRAAEIYSALAQNNPVPPCTFQSSLNLLDEEEKYRRTGRNRDREYWLAALSARPDAVTLSGKSPVSSRTFVRHSDFLPAELTASLASMGKMLGASLTQVIETAVALYLHRLTGADDVILGLPLTGRVGRKMRNIPGMASNILPLRISFTHSRTFADLLPQVVKRKTEMMRHQRYRAEDLRHDLGLQPSDPNIYGLLVNVMSFDYDLKFTGCKATTHNLSNGPVDEFAIVVYDRQDGSDPRIDFDANPAHYTREEVAAHQQRFIALLQQLVSPEFPLHAYELLLPDELNTVISSFNATAHAVDETTLPQLIEAQVARTPDLTAIVFDDRSLTYAELNARANRLARHLLADGYWPGNAGWNLFATFDGDGRCFAGRVENGSRLSAARPGISAGATCRDVAGCGACLRTYHVCAFFAFAAKCKIICARFCGHNSNSSPRARLQPQRRRTASSASTAASRLCHLYFGFHRQAQRGGY